MENSHSIFNDSLKRHFESHPEILIRLQQTVSRHQSQLPALKL